MTTPTPEERARSRKVAARALFHAGYIGTYEPTDDELRGAVTRIL